GGQATAAKSGAASPTGTGNIRYMEAIGQVIVVQKDQTASGEKAVYDMATNSVTMSGTAGGDVSVTQGPNIVSGPRLVVHLDTGVSHFEGGRVKSLFVPSSNKPADSKPTPPGDAKTAPSQQKPRSNAGGNNTTGLY